MKNNFGSSIIDEIPDIRTATEIMNRFRRAYPMYYIWEDEIMTKKAKNWKPKKLSLTERFKKLEEENIYLRARVEAMNTLPVIDKEVFTRLLETVYAAKGGMSSWARSNRS